MKYSKSHIGPIRRQRNSQHVQRLTQMFNFFRVHPTWVPHHLCMSLLFITFKASALWADAFYKSKCPSVCVFVRPSVCLSVHF